ncbi:MAG: hypothetical protein ACPG4N_01205 [Gammaproteobacteria bacterium]
MQIPITKKKPSPEEDQLLRAFRQLSAGNRETLLSFAEFLVTRNEDEVTDGKEEPQSVPKPQHEPRPLDETVVAAIKRLTRTYPMVERGLVFHEVSDLMTQHLVKGREARSVIDELEALFLARYRSMAE